MKMRSHLFRSSLLLLATLGASACCGVPPIDGAGADRSGAAAGPSVSGAVSVAPGLRQAAREGKVLFIIARGGAGREMVAVARLDGDVLPREFVLSSEDAMSNGTPFSGPLDITARLSRSGDAAAGPGDLEGTASRVAPGAKDVRIELVSVRP